MIHESLLATADADQPNLPVLAAWAVTVIALLLSVGAGRRLALGVAEALFVAGVSGLLLLNYAALGDLPADPGLLSTSLVSLTVVWFIVAVWVERVRPVADDARTARRLVRQRLAIQAATLCGLLGIALTWIARQEIGTNGLLVRSVVLLCVALGLHRWQHLTLARYAASAIVVAIVTGATGDMLSAAGAKTVLLINALGVGSLAMVIVATLVDWRRRVFIWRNAPQRLTEPPPMHRRLYTLVVLAGVLTGVLGLARVHHPLTPLATAAAALATLTVAHRWGSDPVGEAGLALAGQTVALVPLAWLPASPGSGLLGWSLVGLYMLWLARFWQQQLDGERPWTTAGRLIPAARNLSLAAVGGQIVWAALYAAEQTPRPDWQCWAAIVCMLLHGWLLLREARDRGDERAALAAALVLTTATLTTSVGDATLVARWPTALWLAIAALVLAGGAYLCGTLPSYEWVWKAYVSGWLPLASIYDITIGHAGATRRWAIVPTALLLALAVVLRPRRVRSAPTDRGSAASSQGPGC